MKIRLKWPDCNYDKFRNETVFWVEATEEELEKEIYRYIEDAELGAFVKHKDAFVARETGNLITEGSFYLLVNRDCTLFKIEQWAFPYGGMWNAGNPFLEVKVMDAKDKSDLKIKMGMIN